MPHPELRINIVSKILSLRKNLAIIRDNSRDSPNNDTVDRVELEISKHGKARLLIILKLD